VRAVASLVLQSLQDTSGAFNSFQPHDDIGALERQQIPENDKGASRQRQILLLSGSLAPFFLVCRGLPWTTEETPFNWSGMARPQHQMVFMVQPCGGG